MSRLNSGNFGNFGNFYPDQFQSKFSSGKKLAKISKSNSQGIDPKFLYVQNRNDSLNQFQFFEIKIAHPKKLILIPEFNLSMSYVRIRYSSMFNYNGKSDLGDRFDFCFCFNFDSK